MRVKVIRKNGKRGDVVEWERECETLFINDSVEIMLDNKIVGFLLDRDYGGVFIADGRTKGHFDGKLVVEC